MPSIYLLEATPYSEAGTAEVTVRFATKHTTPGKPAFYNSVVWKQALTVALNTTVKVFDGDFGGGTRQYGAAVIDLRGGELDALVGYNWDGRSVTVWRGDEDAAFGSFIQVFKGTVGSVSWNRSALTLNLSDYSEVVGKAAQQTLYAGTGAAEGGEDLKGKTKPLAFGAPRNVEPVQINSVYLVYQFHSRAAEAVDAVFDGGVALTAGSDYASYAALIAATVAAGSYATCKAEGLIRLGAPVAFVLTADVQGDNTGGFVETAADIIERVAVDFTELGSGDIDTAAFTALNTANSAACSYYAPAGDTTSAAQIFDALMVSVGGFWTFTAERKLTVRQFAFGSSVANLGQYTALDSVARQDTPVPYWRRKMGYARCWRPQNSNEIAAIAAGSIALDINQEDFSTASDGKAFIHGLNTDGGRADTDGYYYLDGQMVTVKRDQFADGSTLKTSQTATGFIVHDSDPVTPSFKDFFAGSSGTDLDAHTPDLGTSWTDITGTARTWQLTGTGQASVPGTASSVRVIYRANNAPSSADMFSEFQLDAQPEVLFPNVGLMARYQSATSFYALAIYTSGASARPLQCRLRRITGAGTSSDLGDFGVTVAFVPGMKFRLTCRGSTIGAQYRLPGSSEWIKIFEETDANITLAGAGGIFSGAVDASSGDTGPAAKVSNYRDGNLNGPWTVSSEKVAAAFCRYDGASWEYDTGSGWTDFTRSSSMHVIGSLVRGASAITSGTLTQPQVLPETDAKTVILRSAFIKEAQRFVVEDDTAVKTKHLLAREAEVTSLLDEETDADTENARQFALLKSRRSIYTVPVQRAWLDAVGLEVGDTLTLTLPRFGLDVGVSYLLIGMETAESADWLNLTLWG